MTDLMTEFSPGTSPPPVRIPMRFPGMRTLLRMRMEFGSLPRVHSIEGWHTSRRVPIAGGALICREDHICPRGTLDIASEGRTLDDVNPYRWGLIPLHSQVHRVALPACAAAAGRTPNRRRVWCRA